ncbi:hypothetical protein L198_02215 [Cryptococcus wingfieldii CBS 7118]|uniref:DH domain-containing protein n=1 Tax=Cryptococcus wingfieldii CBS 7118 TaxID=1295528 RepID=A0A1E3JR62_9TREE|nr:hypothetical protein L198_02215 [Cryptococcus wingfieldii CBS 7118]ODO03369.1 hypothetical protein L198_02215 [Cryptococcus wingfieldii CBS 7118]
MYVDDTVDEYSWIDPSEVGSDRLRTTVPSKNLPSPPNEEASRQPGPSRHLSPEDSYNLLLLYQSTSPAFRLFSSYSPFASLSPGLQQQLGHAPHFDPEFWYEVVDKTFHDSLDSKEQNRQESWWEMVRSEKMYVEDLGVICDVLIHGLRTADPPIIEHSRLEPFINEVFSTSVLLYQSHLKILSRVLERQREQWPLMMSLTDIYLENFLELLDLYDAYMKNYPYAKARAEREAARNPKFALFLTSPSIPRKGINTFLMRPATRLPRVILILRALLHRTPLDHQDQEDIPTLIDILHRVVKSSEPGISSAEEKIGLWDVAERLMFKKGEIVVTSITTIPEFPWLLTMNGGTIVAFNLRDMMTTVDPQTWVRQRRIDGVLLSRPGQHVAWMSVGKSKGRTLVAYAVYANTSHNTVFAFVEPFQPHPHLGTASTRFPSQPPFRLLSTLTVPGYASSLTFFRATLAVITEKEITITEIGNPNLNTLPTTQGLGTLEEGAPLLKILSGGLRRGGGRPLGMWQTGDNEFILVYDWGACYVTKFGEISRSGTYLRWNGLPSQAVFQSPYLLLFGEFGGRAEVRDVVSGRMCEIIEERGLRLMKSTREGQTMCGWTATGLVQVVETVTL